MQNCFHTSALFSKCFKKVKAFLSQNSFLTTIAECSFKRFNMQHPHTLFKLKRFVFILNTELKMTLIKKRCPLWSYQAFYMQFSQCTLFTKTTPTNYRIHQNFNSHINKRETPKTCLTNHKGSISHH